MRADRGLRRARAHRAAAPGRCPRPLGASAARSRPPSAAPASCCAARPWSPRAAARAAGRCAGRGSGAAAGRGALSASLAPAGPRASASRSRSRCSAGSRTPRPRSSPTFPSSCPRTRARCATCRRCRRRPASRASSTSSSRRDDITDPRSCAGWPPTSARSCERYGYSDTRPCGKAARVPGLLAPRPAGQRRLQRRRPAAHAGDPRRGAALLLARGGLARPPDGDARLRDPAHAAGPAAADHRGHALAPRPAVRA